MSSNLSLSRPFWRHCDSVLTLPFFMETHLRVRNYLVWQACLWQHLLSRNRCQCNTNNFRSRNYRPWLAVILHSKTFMEQEAKQYIFRVRYFKYMSIRSWVCKCLFFNFRRVSRPTFWKLPVEGFVSHNFHRQHPNLLKRQIWELKHVLANIKPYEEWHISWFNSPTTPPTVCLTGARLA